MKILMTGFDPFGGETVNPAYEAVKLLADEVAGVKVAKLEIPTVFGKAAEAVEKGILEHQPDVVICVGQAGRRADVEVERIAINLMEAPIPDNAGNQPMDKKCQEDGPDAYFATLPVKAMVKQMQEKGIPASVSYTAGSYVCNNVMYDLLYMLDKRYPHIRGGFIHVPYATSQGIGKPVGTPTMSLETMAQALEAAVEAVVYNKNVDVHMGITD